MLNRIDRAFKDRARTIEQMRRFVGDASHELRTPLVSVRGYAELYRMGALQSPEEIAQAMERIEKEAVRMGGLVEDLLELARLDETKPLELAEVDLLPLARDAALDANAANPDRTITVTTSLPPVSVPEPGPSAAGVDAIGADPADSAERGANVHAARAAAGADAAGRAGNGNNGSQNERGENGRGGGQARARAQGSTAANATGPIAFAGATLARLRGRRPRKAEPLTETMPLPIDEIPEPETVKPIVMAEENKLRQVLNNLIGNAIRYTPAGSPLEIGVVVDVQTRQARLDVIDHGEGVPPQIRDKIFQRFWRADTSRTRETGGSGLGLAIVSSIVAAHHGTVDVVETPGGGATFRVALPLADSPAAPQPVA
jgi:two-component system OmpR family sensor kinase